MHFHKDIVSGLVLLLFCALGAMSVAQLPDPSEMEVVGPSSLPKACLIITAFFACLLIFRGIRKGCQAEDAKFNFCWKSILFFGFFLLYMIAMVKIGSFFVEKNWVEIIPYAGGFSISTLLFLIISFIVLKRKNPVEIVSVAVITTAVLAISFGGFFKIILP